MIYRLNIANKKVHDIEAVRYCSFSELGMLEKDLEDLLADHLFDLLFEDSPLMPIFQERKQQEEADLYALNQAGDLVIFELKRAAADESVTLQLLKYAQRAGQWNYSRLNEMFIKHTGAPDAPDQSGFLKASHKEAFELTKELDFSEFNRKQKLYIVANAANTSLIEAVDYWRRMGLPMEFLPYRIFRIGEENYFEFFTPPYDTHRNVGEISGLLFDTNRRYDEDALWNMIEKRRISAFGDAKRFVDYLSKKDIIFYCHRYKGIVAAARVKSAPKNDGPNERYCNVEFLTSVPQRSTGVERAMPYKDVEMYTRKSFYWARTIKVPYLNAEETHALLDELMKVLGTKEQVRTENP